MNQAKQTLESIQTDFDQIAAISDDSWNHNAHYHSFLLSFISENCREALEIGCGTGEFTRLLAKKSEKVRGIDLSPQMIRIAQERSKLNTNIEFICANAMSHDLYDNYFDCIASLTTIHHLPIEEFLKKIKKALKPKGVFVCLDLYKNSDLTDFFFDPVAFPISLVMRFVKTKKFTESKELRVAYAEHGKTDSYLTLPQIKRICAELLPGATVKRHLLWRYSIVWKKDF